MTILQALEQLDAARFNTCTRGQKIAWLSELDGLVHKLIISAHAGGEGFSGYDEDTPADRELLVGAPFEEMYRYWLEAKLDYENGEMSRFNNANAMFEAAWQRFADHYHRENKPLPEKTAFF